MTETTPSLLARRNLLACQSLLARQPRLVLNRTALAHNLQVVKRHAPTSKVVSMVKADAYGHGLDFALSGLSASDAFGVACMAEARQIRTLGYAQPVTLIEGVFSAAEWHEASQQGFECVIHHAQQLLWALANPQAYLQNNLKIWLKLNSGMNRLGFSPTDLLLAARQLRQAGFNLVLTMHFANADVADHALNQQQMQQFLHLKQQLEPIAASCCNSAALLQWPAWHFDYVRPGIMLYGASPLAGQSAPCFDLKPVMQFESQLMAIHDVAPGQSVGYGSRVVTTRPTRLGIVACGYGDGYPRVMDEHAFVSIDGHQAPLIGRVSMDMLAVDLTGLPLTIGIGAQVILWGHCPTVDWIAKCNNTISYELLCRLTNRPQRIIAG